MLPVKVIYTVPEGTKWDDVANGTVVPQVTYTPLPVIRNTFNSRFFPKNYEVNNEPSKTVPNQAMTVRELIIRFASGLPVNAGKVPIFEGETDMPDIDKMDLIERHEYYEELKQQRNEAIEAQQKRRAAAEEIKMEKIVSDRIKAKELEEEQKVLEEFRKNKKGGSDVEK